MILDIAHVTRRYAAGGPEALREVSLRIAEPQVVGLVGRNGAGKSTLLRMIPPLIHPTRGRVEVFGLDPWAHQEANKLRIGYLADSDVHPANIRGKDLLDLCAAVYPTWDAALVERFVKRFELNLRMPLRSLSKGQQRQVGLLSAVGHRPELLILDEPASGLDPVARRELLNVVIELLGDTGATVLFATHLFADVERLAERIVIMDRGRIIADRPLDELKSATCRVELPAAAAPVERMRAWDGCIRVDTVDDRTAAVLLCSPAQARERLVAAFGPAAAPTDVQPISLEDLFVAWTGSAA